MPAMMANISEFVLLRVVFVCVQDNDKQPKTTFRLAEPQKKRLHRER